MKWIKKNNFKTMKEYVEHTFKDFKTAKKCRKTMRLKT